MTKVQELLDSVKRDLLAAVGNAVTHEQAERLAALATLVAAEKRRAEERAHV